MALPRVLANFTTSLATKISSTASSLTLSRSTDPDGTTLSGQYILTVDEGTSVEEHMLVTLAGSAGTIDTRGLSKVDMTTSKTANKFAHDRGAETKITNAVLIKIVNRLNGTEAFDSVALTGVASIAGLSTPTSGETTKAANVAYVNGVAIAGAPDATTAVKGIVKMSTAPASATSPIAVGDNDPRVPTTDQIAAIAGTSGTPSASNKFVTNDDTAATPAASKVVRFKSDSKLDDAGLALTTAGDTVYSDGTDLQRLAIGTAGQVLKSNSAATAPQWINQKQALFTTQVSISADTTETTLLTGTINGNTLMTNGVLKGYILFDGIQVTPTKTITFRLKYGATTLATLTLTNGNASTISHVARLEFILAGTGATNTQKGVLSFQSGFDGFAGAAASATDLTNGFGVAIGTATEDSTANKTFSITAQFNATTSNSLTAEIGFLEIIN